MYKGVAACISMDTDGGVAAYIPMGGDGGVEAYIPMDTDGGVAACNPLGSDGGLAVCTPVGADGGVVACTPMGTDGDVVEQGGLSEPSVIKRRLVLALVDSEGCVMYQTLYQGLHPPHTSLAAPASPPLHQNCPPFQTSPASPPSHPSQLHHSFH